MQGVFLPLDTEDVTVERVIRWMKDNQPLSVSEASTEPVVHPPLTSFDSAPFPPFMDTGS